MARTNWSRRVGVWSAAALAAAAEGQILSLNSGSITTYLPAGASAVQDIRPLHSARGVGVDGVMRAGSVQGWACAGNPFGDSAPSMSKVGDVNLATGAYMPTEIDISLPQPGMAAWRIGRSFNGRQETSGAAHRDSNGYQGYNWFQMSQPAIVTYGSPDRVYIVYGADRYLEFKYVTDETAYTDQFAGVNGCAGVVNYVDPNNGGDAGLVDYYIYYDQHGVATYFFGAVNSGAAAYQIWKIVDPAGNVAYVGDASTASTAISSGYNADGAIIKAYDAAGRRYCYSYSSGTIAGVKRLEQVVVEVDAGGGWGGCGTETLVAKVDYLYYATTESGRGLAGDLKLVTVTTPMTDSGVEQKRRMHYRYYTGGGYVNSAGQRGEDHQVKLVLGNEGCRNHDYTADSALEYGGGGADPEFLTDTDANLKAYSLAYLEYMDTAGSFPYRVYTGFFNGECGCGGGGTNGTYELAYATNGSFSGVSGYDDEWLERVVVKQPDTVYASQYFDECGQPISRVVTNTDPSGSPTKTWATEVVRDSSGRVIEIHTPKNITAYTHSTGAFTRSSGAGLIHIFDRVSGGTMDGFPESAKYKEGTSGTANFTSWTDYTSRGLVVGAATDYRPMVNSRRAYHTATSTYSTGGTYDSTAMSYAWWSATSTNVLYLTLKQATTTNPTVSTGTNGSNSPTSSDRFVRKDGTTAFSVAPDGISTYMQYTSGQLTKQIADVITSGSFPSGDDPNTDWGITETGSGSDRTTLYSYDAQGRPDEMTEPDSRVHKSYYSVLVDGRSATINWPRKTTASGGTYYGPASYGVTNHAGKPEFTGLIAISSSGSTASLTSWIDETDTDPILALTTGSLARMSTSLYDSAGSRVSESRTYHVIPASGAGSSGTNYDATTFVYDVMGRKIRTVDPTLTITRTSFDDLGRVYQTHLGTDDTGLTGSPMAGSSNMVKTSENAYDSGSAGGNSHLTSRTLYVENSTTDQRVTTYDYDFRGRLLLTTNPVAPHSLNKYDNLGRVIASAQYSAAVSASTDPAASGTQTYRVSLNTSSYDELGRVYQTRRYEIDQSDGSDDDYLTSDTWRDAAGRVTKVKGHELSKTIYDRLGRTVQRFVLASDNDTVYANMDDVSGDLVLEEHQSVYESTNSDNVVMTVTINRDGDDTTTYGGLDIDGVALEVSSYWGRPQITAMWYDDLDRVIDTVSYGNNGASAFYRKPAGVWLTQPTRSQTALRTTTTYDDDGTVLETESPGQPSTPAGTSGVKTRFEYDDLGRQTAVINNYVNGSAGGGSNDDEDQIIRYEYTAGLRTKIVADLSGTDQETLYIYGTTAGTPSANKVTTKNRLRAVKYPDSTNVGTTQAYIDGTSDADVVSYAYNAQGQETLKKDQAANVIETFYDTLGRQRHVKATTIGGSFDNTVKRISTVYADRGTVDTVTQFSSTTVAVPDTSNIIDQVQYEYDGWGNLITFTQDVDSAIGGSGRDEFILSYTWDKATGGRQALRRDTASYPGGSDLTYVYDTGIGVLGTVLHDPASRVEAVKVGATIVSRYYYHGQGIVTWTNLTEPGISAQAGTSSGYPNWDNFNRPISTKWTKYFPGATDFFDLDINWDKSGSIVGVVDNIRLTGIGGTRNFDTQYSNDNLGRLLRARQGSLSGTTLSSATRDEQWTDGTNSKLSQTGNWLYRRLDLNGNGTFTDAGDETQSSDATFNDVNELTSRTFTLSGGGSPTTYTYVYDANGNMTDDGKDYTYKYDAFGRLKEVWTRGGGAVKKSEYTYNGLGYRIGWHYDVSRSGGGAPDGVVDSDDPWYWWMHDERWRQIATFRGDDDDPKERFVYHAAGLDGMGGSSYIDAVVLRDKDNSDRWRNESDGVLEQRRYICQTWRNDTALIATDVGALVEATKFAGYGESFNVPAGDVNSDGDWDAGDSAAITGGYDVNKDIDMDGAVSAADITAADAVASGYHVEGRGVLSADEVAIRKGYAGYEVDPILLGSDLIAAIDHVRHRVFSSYTGRWNRRDPLGYVDGVGLYAYLKNAAVVDSDPSGEASLPCHAGSNCTGMAFQPGTPINPVGPPVPPGVGPPYTGPCLADPAVRALLAAIATAGCSVTINALPATDPLCAIVPGVGVIGGIYCCSSNAIGMCPGGGCQILVHELIHRLDHCTGGFHCSNSGCGNATNCRDQACTEIRAYALSGVCCKSGNFTYYLDPACVREKAEASLTASGLSCSPSIVHNMLSVCLPKMKCKLPETIPSPFPSPIPTAPPSRSR